MGWQDVQTFMRQAGIDAWVVCDFRGSNSVFARLLPGKRFTTRRVVLMVPSDGDPVLLAQQLDAAQFEQSGISVDQYISWKQLHDWLNSHLNRRKRVAMEYSPQCALPVISIVDAGTIELIRSMGVEIVSSADLVQVSVARWSVEAVKQHEIASRLVAQIKDEAFDLIGKSVMAGRSVSEYDVQQFIMSRFKQEGLETPDAPIVAINAHSGDPHFEVSATEPSTIKRGDWVLMDLWARVPGDANIFSDITWTGYVGHSVPPRHRQVYDAVNRARDASLNLARARWESNQLVRGWELDDAAHDILVDAGLGDFVRHRTGHSLSPGDKVHGMGMNLDNLETQDQRQMLAEIGFTIEPGAYLPEFGVRSEINVYVDPERGPVVTSCKQDDVVLIG